MMKFTSLAVLIILMALPVLAADGDQCANAGITSARNTGIYSSFREECRVLCDGKTSSDSDCDDFTITDPPDYMVVDIAEDDSCSGAATVAISHLGHASLDAHSYQTLSVGGVTAAVVATEGLPLPVLRASLSSMTGCTDFTVVVRLLYRKP